MGHDAGVVDQGVNLAEVIDDFMDHAAHVLFIAHVRGDGEGLRFESLKLAKGLAHPLDVRVGKYDSGSRSYQSMRRMAPDALGGAGNNDNSALHAFPSPLTPNFDNYPISNNPTLQYSHTPTMQTAPAPWSKWTGRVLDRSILSTLPPLPP